MVESKKYVYQFAVEDVEGNMEMKPLLGGKGANLHEMCKMELPVPAGFTISTEACTVYQRDRKWPKGLADQVRESIAWLEKQTGKRFGDPNNPLLVSVRSGARVSMPGMMDTVLNLGLNQETLEGLAKNTNDRRFALDTYRRFLAMFGDVVLNLRTKKDKVDPFEERLEKLKMATAKTNDVDLDENDLQELVGAYQDLIATRTGKAVESDPWKQLDMAIDAVFRSWDNDRAKEYRRIYQIPDDWGTAVNVQSMVFGNMGDDCATGVAFTRNPATGTNEMYGEYLVNAEGEDVVAGVRTPEQICHLKDIMPKLYDELDDVRHKLENHYHDMQDLEFTIEKDKLYILQCRSGKRTATAAIKIALEMLDEGLVDEKTALTRIEADQINALLRPVFETKDAVRAEKEGAMLATGLPAGPGAASGRICFFPDEVERRKSAWEKVILVRVETSPEDIKGMELAEGILTARGGMTSHAALVARQRGKVCVAGCSDIEVDYSSRTLKVGDHVLREGDELSIDGSTGRVFLGALRTSPSEVVEVLLNKTKQPEDCKSYQNYARIMELADKYRTLHLRANGDRPEETAIARAFGAEGIGLCRTEHMFFGDERIGLMRQMILSETLEEREEALALLLPYQRKDFIAVFEAVGHNPVTIRTLDPPLHEFLPRADKEKAALSEALHVPLKTIDARIAELKEFNPMLGLRGCRLGILHPEITRMQARAILEAACHVKKEKGIAVKLEIMIPLVSHPNELANQRAVVEEVAVDVFEEQNLTVDYKIGSMIEIPRAAICAEQIAEYAEFFSFGTNDLTQMGFGISRDDYSSYIGDYLEHGVLKTDPFTSLDLGIFGLMELAIAGGRKRRPDMHLGICGEHGGDPASIMLCHKAGLDYVSCSPYRVPIARLAAAQAAIVSEREDA